MQLENVIEYPQHLGNIKEIKSMSNATDKQIAKLSDAIDSLENNLLIETSDEIGISRREKILVEAGINAAPQDTDTLEERRFRVALYWYDYYPYTEKKLRDRLDALCGAGQYILNIDYANEDLYARLPLSNKANLRDMVEILELIVPEHISIDAGLLYNTWDSFKGKTWDEMKSLTWTEAKENQL